MTLHELFEAQAGRTPDQVAVAFDRQKLTYGELNHRANQIAHYLRGLGVGPETLVGLFVERSPQMLVGLLGILKAGGAYVPIDPSYPKERVIYMLEDARAPVLLTQSKLAADLPAHRARVVCLDDAELSRLPSQPTSNPPSGSGGDNLAYVIYTSGTTGQPKGSLITHRNVTRLFSATMPWFGFNEQDVWTLFHSCAFDFSVWEIWGALLYGGRLVMVPYMISRSPVDFYELLAREQVTVLSQTPSAFRQLIPAEESVGQKELALRYVVFGGEALEMQSLRPWFERHGDEKPRLVNMYGITETTVHVTYRPLSKKDLNSGSVIGVPIPDLQVYILDPQRQPVPIGVQGEMYVGGAGLARGYLRRPELTAERFIPDHLTGRPGSRLYRTGDLARFLPGRDIEYLGRIDQQVKIRGFRIELGEVEDALRQHPGVREAVVTASEDALGDKRLVAYYTGPDAGEQSEATEEAEALRGHLARSLPEYMMPAAYVKLKAMPLTPSGKLDRKALPAPEGGGYAVRKYEAPQGVVETILAGIWADLLKVERVGRHDHFFELGGHSLLAVTLVERMRQEGLHVDVRTLFSRPTLAELATVVGYEDGLVEVPPNLIPPQCNAIIPEMLPLVGLSAVEIARIVSSTPGGAANVQDIYPLGPLQEGILFHHLMASEGDLYLVAMLYGFDSRARLDGYLRALQAVMDRHDILRTAVAWEGLREPVQVVWRKAPMPVEEIQFDPAGGDVVEQLKERFDPRRHSIDVRQAPLIRAHVTHDAAHERWLLLILLHHLVGDHTTLEVMEEEVQAHLLGRGDRLPAPLPFRNFVAHARRGMNQEEHDGFFRRMLGDVDEPTTPFGLRDVQGGGSEIEEAVLEVDARLARRLRERARKLGVSAASLCHLAWAIVLARVSGREDVVFGTVLFGRMKGGEGADRVMGLFINTLPVRIRVGEESVEASTRAAHVQLANLLRHEHASLALAQRCSAVPARAPLFSALLNYRYSPRMAQARSGEEMQAWEGIQRLYAQERTNYPFTLSVTDQGSGFILTAQAPALIGPLRVCEFMHTALTGLIVALETAPATAARSIDILPASERHRVLEEWNDTKAEYPREKCIHELFEEQAERTPEAVALTLGGQHLTYGALNRQANRLAHQLRGWGVGPETRVGLCVERSLEMVVGLLAILKAGGAYVPLDPAYPKERLAFMLEDAGIRVLLTQEWLRRALPQGGMRVACLDRLVNSDSHSDDHNPHLEVNSGQVAYVLYTSGSTGTPKGVEVPHRGIVRLLCGTDFVRLGPDEVFLQSTSISFDVSAFEIWGALLHGGRCVLFPDRVPGLTRLGALLKSEKVTTLCLTPSLFNMVIDVSPDLLSPVSQVLLAGEALSVPHIYRALPLLPNTRLVNVYGPTESAVYASCYHIPRTQSLLAASIPIGRPLANTQLYILDQHFEPVPIGVAGELCIGGDGLARGYMNRAEETCLKFIPNPFSTQPGARLYRTGDLCRYLPDGNIEFLGRLDNQVKIRGFRIELGEIESALAAHPGVSAAAAMVREPIPGEKHLVAYCVPHRHASPPTSKALHDFLKKKLPDFMVPADFFTLEALPLTPSGKLDRRALPAMSPSLPQDEKRYVPPRNLVERQLVKIWEEIFDARPIGIEDDFFNLGGHSLLAVRMMSRIEDAYGQRLPLATLFAGTTIKYLAERLHMASRTALQSVIVPVQPGGDRPPLFFLHGGGGLYCRKLAQLLGPEQPLYGVNPRDNHDDPTLATIEAIAGATIRELLALHSQGPYVLGGYCHGGLIAYEMARQMQQQGLEVGMVILLDAWVPRHFDWLKALIHKAGWLTRLDADVQTYLYMRLHKLLVRASNAHRDGIWKFLNLCARAVRTELLRLPGTPPEELLIPGPPLDDPDGPLADLRYRGILMNYRPKPYPGLVVLLRTSSVQYSYPTDRTAGWGKLASQIEVYDVPGDHATLQTEHIGVVAEHIGRCLGEYRTAAQEALALSR